MLNRVCAGFVVAFWVVMMATLVRVEFYPQPLPLDRYPTRRVLQKIFANPLRHRGFLLLTPLARPLVLGCIGRERRNAGRQKDNCNRQSC